MILQTIKQISCLLCLCCFLQQSAFSQDDKDKPAYTLFDNTGKQISYGELIKRLSGYDVIFLGELHNCPITHWLEFEITRSIYNIHKDQLMLGAEMFESDNQLIFDEYMQQKISYDRFEAEAASAPIFAEVFTIRRNSSYLYSTVCPFASVTLVVVPRSGSISVRTILPRASFCPAT